MKLGERLRSGLLEKNSKEYLMKKLEEKLFEISNSLNKGCTLEFKYFTLEERKEIVEALRDEDLILKGRCNYEEQSEYLNSEYYLLWDKTGVIEKIHNIKDPCQSCNDLSCLDGYKCYYQDEYYRLNGKPYLVFDVKGLIRAEKINEKYRVNIIALE